MEIEEYRGKIRRAEPSVEEFRGKIKQDDSWREFYKVEKTISRREYEKQLFAPKADLPPNVIKFPKR